MLLVLTVPNIKLYQYHAIGGWAILLGDLSLQFPQRKIFQAISSTAETSLLVLSFCAFLRVGIPGG